MHFYLCSSMHIRIGIQNCNGEMVVFIFTGFCKKSQLTEDQLTSLAGGDPFALLLSITVHSVHFLGLKIFLKGHTFCGGLL